MRELHCLAQVAPAVRHSTGGNPQFRCDFAIGHSTQQGVLFGFPLVQFGEDRPVTEWRLKMPLNLDPSGERLMLVRGGEEQEVFAREEMMAATREILCDKGIR